LSAGEMLQIQRALKLYGLVEPDVPRLEDRETLLSTLTEVVSSEGYYERALAKSTGYALGLLDAIVEGSGTSGSIVAVRKAFEERFSSHYYYPSHRYAVDGAARPYYLLPEGLTAVLEHLKRKGT